MVKSFAAQSLLCPSFTFHLNVDASLPAGNDNVSPAFFRRHPSLFTLNPLPFTLVELVRPRAMASSSPTTSIPLQEPVFLQFLHDVHHAYLLLHRAMALLPPTLIPNIEPTPLPSTEVWNQPEGLRPDYSDSTNAFIDTVHLPPPDLEEEVLMDDLLQPNLPEPHQHVAAPPPDALPDPSKLSATASTPPKRKQKAKATPKAPANRRRIQGNRLACARDFGSLVHGMAGLACARDAPSFMIFIIIIITIITITIIIIIIIITIIMLINTVMVDVIISIFFFIIITIITIIMLINTVIVDVMISIFFFFFIIITIIMLINTVMVDVSKSV